VSVQVERKLLKWGNGYGLRLTGEEVASLGLRAGETVRATIDDAAPSNDLDSVALLSTTRPYNVKAILEDEAHDRARRLGARRPR
jgi:antitoxin component of MazEF toxin-antitoxin module